MLRLIQIGLGSFGFSWANIVKESQQWEPVAYVDMDKEKLMKASGTYGVPKNRCYSDMDAALSEVEADAALVVVPPEAHMGVAIKAFVAGLNVLCEKPLASNMEDAKTIVHEAKKRNLKLMVSQNYRYNRGPRTVRRILENGKVGEPSYAIINFYNAPHFGGFREKMAHPLLVEMSIHHFDLMRFIFDTNPKNIYAKTWRPRWSWFDGDPCTSVLVEMDSGVIITYLGSWVTLGDQTTRNGDWRIECSAGSIHWDTTIRLKQKGAKEIFEESPLLIPLEDRAYSLHACMHLAYLSGLVKGVHRFSLLRLLLICLYCLVE